VINDGRRFGAPPTPYSPPETPTGKVNVTDPDSGLVKSRAGFIQGSSAQAAVNEHHVLIAAELESSGNDFGRLGPLVDKALAELERAGVTAQPDVVLADAGYWHQQQIEAIVARGTKVLIPPDSSNRRGTRPGWDKGLYAFMPRVLETDQGRALLRQAEIADRAGVRPYEVQPPDRALPAPRKIRQPLGMAADRGDPQPLKLHRHAIGLQAA
jgi:Transposase DDE domain